MNTTSNGGTLNGPSDAFDELIAERLAYVGILLGQCWLNEMTAQSLAALNEPDVASCLDAIGWQVPTPTPEVVESLAIDYCQLLIGPRGQLSPVESVWASQQFQGASASSMKSFFELLPGYQSPSSLSDHIGVQLDFASHLLLAAEGDAEPVQLFVAQRLDWAEQLLKGVHGKAETDFYRGLAVATKHWISCVQA